MNVFFQAALAFIKKEVVFVVAFTAAVAAAILFEKPSAAYASYINWSVLFTLFSLMTVVGGLEKCGVFHSCAVLLCRRMKSVRATAIALVVCCFFFSMLITNDVSLLTFVPFTLLTLRQMNEDTHAAYIVVIETAAANLGSMLTPMGNPQNLLLYTKMKTTFLSFCSILLPYSILSLVLLLTLCLLIRKSHASSCKAASSEHLDSTEKQDKGKSQDAGGKIKRRSLLAMYAALFCICLLAVMKVLPAWIPAILVLACVFAFDRAAFLKSDYVLLLTFTAFFIFTGIIGNTASVREFLVAHVQNHEFITGLLTSQIISNVPATLLLEPFARDTKALLLGVNIGGLGTLVASLASLISFNLYTNDARRKTSTAKYFWLFTAVNVALLAPLCGLLALIR